MSYHQTSWPTFSKGLQRILEGGADGILIITISRTTNLLRSLFLEKSLLPLNHSQRKPVNISSTFACGILNNEDLGGKEASYCRSGIGLLTVLLSSINQVYFSNIPEMASPGQGTGGWPSQTAIASPGHRTAPKLSLLPAGNITEDK